jgi:hypothetical protein
LFRVGAVDADGGEARQGPGCGWVVGHCGFRVVVLGGAAYAARYSPAGGSPW